MKKSRLDHYLTARFPDWSRSHIKRLIDEGFILVGGERKKAGYLLRGGDEIRVVRRSPLPPKAGPEAIPLDILYEDDFLLVLNKPAGLVVHPAAGNWQGTLVNALLYHGGNLSKGGEGFRPGIVHRLDKGTTGVMVVAKTDPVHRSLAGQFKHHKVRKVYHAVVFRPFSSREGTIRSAIGRDPKHRLKFSSRGSKLKEAVTVFKVMRNFRDLALLELVPQTGRTHQLRVHLSEAKHPIVGDLVYGGGTYLPSIHDEEVRRQVCLLSRPMLHASELRFTHPASREERTFIAPWPNDFRELVDVLKNEKKNL